MKRHEWWRQEYRRHRDLDHLSAEQLSERMFDCMNNGRVQDERGRLGIMPFEEGGEQWMVLHAEVLEECVLRNYDYPGPIDISRFRDAFDNAFGPVPNMNPIIDKYKLTKENPYILKFGDPVWLRKSLEVGAFRISAASFYERESHNHARRDSELKRILNPNPHDPRMRTFMEKHGIDVPRGKAPSFIAIQSPTDYYLFSTSTVYSRRLFGDFSATGCLVIHTPGDFLNRITAAVSDRLPGWRPQMGFVNYYDPVRADLQLVDRTLRFAKPFRHAYQNELRLTFTPPNPQQELPAFEIEIGSLRDCAELVDIEAYPPVIIPPDPADAPVITYGQFNGEVTMVNELPDVAKIQGMMLSREAGNFREWFFKIQYTDGAGTWQQIKVPMLDGLYLLNMLRDAEKNQHLELWNRE
ncbi:MAG: hypothetical protein QOC81_1874 [Thermoanaerobaculia bacterium]|jgi:hypothetical protein|nr:hypothetical protein [Thermoanaerobaculia bacterium]